MGNSPGYELGVLRGLLKLQEGPSHARVIEPGADEWFGHTQLLGILERKSYLRKLDSSGLSRILHRLSSMNVLERSEGSHEYLDDAGLDHHSRVRYHLTPGGMVYARLALGLLADIQPHPYELEDAIVDPRFSTIREWLNESIDVRDSMNPYRHNNDPLRVSLQGGTCAQDFVYGSFPQQANVEQIGTHFTSRDEEDLFEKGHTDLMLVTWHTIRNKMRNYGHPNDWVILRVYRKGAPVFAMQKEHVRRRTLFYPEGAKQRQALARKITRDVDPAEPSQLVPGFADGGYDYVVTQPPNSTIFAAMGRCVAVDWDEEDYFLIASRRLFDPRNSNASIYGLVTHGRVADSRLVREGTRYAIAGSYVIRNLRAEMERMPRYRDIARLLSPIHENSSHSVETGN